MSDNENFEEDFVEELKEIIHDVIPKMCQIWRQMGFPTVKKRERRLDTISHTKELFMSMLEEEQGNKKRFISTVDKLGRQYHQLCKELEANYVEIEEDVPLLEMQKLLQGKLNDLMKEKEKRMEAVRALFDEEDQLCSRLNVEPCQLDRNRIPTTDQLATLQDRIMKLKSEIQTRQEQYISLRDSIRDAMQQLEMSARSLFEVNLFVNDPQKVPLSDDNMMKIKELHQELTEQIKKNRMKAADLYSTIEGLWERLSVEQNDRDIFLTQNKGFAPSTIDALEREMARLNELKRQNIERFIHVIRQDLINLWNLCYVSDAERLSFTPFYAEIYTEELLELHETQVEKYKQLYTNNKEIFTKVHHRDDLWKKMQDIEARSKNSSRLFDNRGCVLLQEEKERKRIVKELPRVEKQLIELLNNYEQTNGHVLYIHGKDYRQFVAEQWAISEEAKENEKIQRQRDRAEKLNSPMPRRLPNRPPIESPQVKERRILAPMQQVLTGPALNPIASEANLSMMSTYSTFTETLKMKSKQACVNSTILMDNKGTPTSNRRNVMPSSTQSRATPTTPLFNTQHSIFQRSNTQSTMASPLFTRPAAARSTPRLTVSKTPR